MQIAIEVVLSLVCLFLLREVRIQGQRLDTLQAKLDQMQGPHL